MAYTVYGEYFDKVKNIQLRSFFLISENILGSYIIKHLQQTQ